MIEKIIYLILAIVFCVFILNEKGICSLLRKKPKKKNCAFNHKETTNTTTLNFEELKHKIECGEMLSLSEFEIKKWRFEAECVRHLSVLTGITLTPKNDPSLSNWLNGTLKKENVGYEMMNSLYVVYQIRQFKYIHQDHEILFLNITIEKHNQEPSWYNGDLHNQYPTEKKEWNVLYDDIEQKWLEIKSFILE